MNGHVLTDADVAAFDATGLTPESEQRIRRGLLGMVGLTVEERERVMYETTYPAAQPQKWLPAD